MSRQATKLKIGNNLRSLRIKQNLTQDEVAKAVEVSRITVIAIEKGDYNPSLELAFRLANFLGTDINEIFFEQSYDVVI